MKKHTGMLKKRKSLKLLTGTMESRDRGWVSLLYNEDTASEGEDSGQTDLKGESLERKSFYAGSFRTGGKIQEEGSRPSKKKRITIEKRPPKKVGQHTGEVQTRGGGGGGKVDKGTKALR